MKYINYIFLYLSIIETKQITWTKLWMVSSRNSWGRRIHKQKETLKELGGGCIWWSNWNQFRDKSSVMLVGSCIPATSYQVLLSEIGNFVVLAIWFKRRVIMFECEGHLHTNVANKEAGHRKMFVMCDLDVISMNWNIIMKCWIYWSSI